MSSLLNMTFHTHPFFTHHHLLHLLITITTTSLLLLLPLIITTIIHRLLLRLLLSPPTTITLLLHPLHLFLYTLITAATTTTILRLLLLLQLLSHPPTPAHAPAKPLTRHHHHPPLPAPVPWMHPPPRRSFVAVEGFVYTKSCKYAGLDTISGATPLLGGVVKLECKNTRYPWVQTGKSDKKGYFYLEAPRSITTFGAHRCKVFLVNAPNGLKPSNLHGGVTGSLLKPHKLPFMSHKLPYLLYSVGPFAFDPNCHPH